MEVDELLKEQGRRWRESLDHGPALTTVMRTLDVEKRLPAGRSRWRPILASAAAVIVIGVVLAIAPLARHFMKQGDQDPLGPAQGCQDRLVASSSTWKREGDGRRLRVLLTNVERSPCRISSYGPVIDLRGNDGRLLGRAQNALLYKLSPGTVRIDPGHRAVVSVRWVGLCPSTSESVSQVRLHLGLDDDFVSVRTRGVRVPVASIAPLPCDPNFVGGRMALMQYERTELVTK